MNDFVCCLNLVQVTFALNFMVRMTSDLEANIVSVERTKEYAETPNEVCVCTSVLLVCITSRVMYMSIHVCTTPPSIGS